MDLVWIPSKLSSFPVPSLPLWRRINEALQKDVFYLRQLARQPLAEISIDKGVAVYEQPSFMRFAIVDVDMIDSNQHIPTPAVTDWHALTLMSINW